MTIAGVLIAANVLFLIFGITNPDVYRLWHIPRPADRCGRALDLGGLVSIFRRVVQDMDTRLLLREETPAMPPARAAGG